MQAIPAVLVALIVVLELIAAIGALYMARGTLYIIAQVLKHTIGRLWIIGPHIEHAILSISDPLMTWLGNQATGLQGNLVQFFQGMWRLNVWTYNELAALANDTYGAILRVNNAQRALIGLAPSKPTQKGVVATGKAARHASRSQSDFNHRTNERLATLERDVGTVRRHGVPVKPGVSFHGLEARLNTVEHKIVEQRNFTRNMFRNISKTDAITVFGVATAALSLEWLRCRNWGRRGLGNVGCRMPRALLNMLLGLGIDALLIADLCLITKGMTKAARLAAPLLEGLAKGLTDLMKCQGVERPVDVGVTYFSPPTGTRWAVLPVADTSSPFWRA